MNWTKKDDKWHKKEMVINIDFRLFESAINEKISEQGQPTIKKMVFNRLPKSMKKQIIIIPRYKSLSSSSNPNSSARIKNKGEKAL